MLLHGDGVEEVAAIDDDGVTHGGVEAFEVEGCELRPVGEDEQGIGIGGGSVGILGVDEVGTGGSSAWARLLAAGSKAAMMQPSASSISTRAMAGDSRMSSVSPLKARPRTARRFPRRFQRAERTLARKRRFW